MWFSHSTETTAPPRRVWDVWTTVEQWPTWDTELREATLDGEFCEGATGELTPRRGRATSFVVTDVDPVRSYTYVADLPLARLVVRRSLHSHDGGTNFTHEVWFEGPLGRVFSRTLGRHYRHALPQVMEAVREQAEASHATGSSTDVA
ncbi:SRPBCC family protein [Halomarina rubra]|uniref:SRPBCC family protein n=1 Tax=Halomarina rubra TaxID=2071873 RepID=A0ABD6AYS3_9EURY|nr:SRPBCC family protein [Halomarina rubra]